MVFFRLNISRYLSNKKTDKSLKYFLHKMYIAFIQISRYYMYKELEVIKVNVLVKDKNACKR